ncbi:hypothetical protein [Nocardioides sp. Iso805N]|uniref:hypothetical protein n=1 Tax=Nocardioides sp. Iso805N TaxID=1283287 RepID=UPI000374422F|nr:hypothetical protein [Nocardioides sp. Iso805N]
MSDFVYLALTLLCFAGLALLVGIIDSRLEPDPHHDPTDLDADEPQADEPRADESQADEATDLSGAVRR